MRYHLGVAPNDVKAELRCLGDVRSRRKMTVLRMGLHREHARSRALKVNPEPSVAIASVHCRPETVAELLLEGDDRTITIRGINRLETQVASDIDAMHRKPRPTILLNEIGVCGSRSRKHNLIENDLQNFAVAHHCPEVGNVVAIDAPRHEHKNSGKFSDILKPEPDVEEVEA